MKKKIITIVASSLGVIVTSALLAAGIFMLVRNKNVEETGNVLGVSWYNEAEEEFEITTAEQLNEFAALSKFYTFEDQTIKLGADIVMNEGNAKDWAEKAPKLRWKPIEKFAGTFDGQGHTISGLYGKVYEAPMALFAQTDSIAVVQNLSLVNTYFETGGSAGAASFAVIGDGKFVKLYSDAIIVNKGDNSGGIITKVTMNVILEECWFEGSITQNGRWMGGIVAAINNGRAMMKHCLFSGDISTSQEIIYYASTDGVRTGALCGVVNKNSSLMIEDSLASGTMSVKHNTYAGTVVGAIFDGASGNMTDVYTTQEITGINLIGAGSGRTSTPPAYMEQEQMLGVKAYQWSTLDFDNYWAVVEGDTPILKHFAKEVPSLAGIEKAYDISWYSSTSYDVTITNLKELYGLAVLSKTNTFENYVIKLGADIVVNEGKATTWMNNPDKAPTNPWHPIGSRGCRFAGTFDGQGHTISGVYYNAKGKPATYVGVFGYTAAGSTIRNLGVTNSYFDVSGNKDQRYVGGIVAVGQGSLDTLYSDITIKADGRDIGGIAGYLDFSGATKYFQPTVNNCWFNGKLIGDTGRRMGGIAGAVFGVADNIPTYSFTNCLYTGYITNKRISHKEDNLGGQYIGGIVGQEANPANVVIKDCLSAGKIDVVFRTYVGSIMGTVTNKASTVTFDNVYSTLENYDRYLHLSNGVVNGATIMLPENLISGVNGFKWTTLDFSKYWAAAKDDTPVLKSFSSVAKVQTTSVAKEKQMVDTAWYNVSKKELTIDTLEELYGFWLLSNCTTFEGQTIKLGADIVVNAVDNATIEAWKAGTATATNPWFAIGQKDMRFKGTFDGQMHTISGIYLDTTLRKQHLGVFGYTALGSTVKNLKVTDSVYNVASDTDVRYVGSIIGVGSGNLDTLYSDVEILCDGQDIGGIVGYMNIHEATTQQSINNLWFNGSISGDTGRRMGGITGAVYGNEKSTPTYIFQNCLNSATISNTRANSKDGLGGQYIGGILGQEANPTNIILKDCLSVGQINVEYATYVGSVMGRLSNKDSTLTIDGVYATQEVYKRYIHEAAGTQNGATIMLPESIITGVNGYKWTTLDFNKYWNAAKEDTPVLKSFSSTAKVQTTSVENEKRMVDIAWYNDSKKELTIDTLEELYGFWLLSNSTTFGGQTIKLGADIVVNAVDNATIEAWKAGTATATNPWFAIGQKDMRFKGTFDGQMHKISGIYLDTTLRKQHLGVFGYTALGSTVKNLKVTDSVYNVAGDTDVRYVGSIIGVGGSNLDTLYSDVEILCDGQDIGGIVGYMNFHEADKQQTINNLWFNGSISGDTGRRMGGIVGSIYGNEKNTPTYMFENCLNSAMISNTRVDSKDELGGQYIGGILGKEANPTNVIFKDCLNSGAINVTYKTYVGNIVGRMETATTVYTMNNVYMITDAFAVPYGESKATVNGHIYKFTKSALSGAGGYQWTNLDFEKYWTAVTDSTPVLTSFVTDAGVFGVDVTKEAQPIDTKWYDNNPNASTFEIKTREELYGLWSLVANGTSFKGKEIDLLSDISINEEQKGTNPWFAIGSAGAPFAGTFDGNNHTISGIYIVESTAGDYQGLFGYTSKESMIKNLKVTDSYFEMTGNRSLQYIGGIVAYAEGSLKNLYSDVDIVTDGVKLGGIVGTLDYTKEMTGRVLENCWFAGSITGEKARQSGGIVGTVIGNSKADVNYTLKNCLFTGYVGNDRVPKSGDGCGGQYIGSMLGFDSGKAHITVTNCLGAGTLKSKYGTYMGSVIGRLENKNSTLKIENSYVTKELFNGKAVGEAVNTDAVRGDATKVALSALYGYSALATIDFDYDKDWSAVLGSVPVPQPLLNSAHQVATFNTKWYYDAKKDESNNDPGTEKNPYQINSANDFYGLAKLVNEEGLDFNGKTLVLTDDIYLNEGDVHTADGLSDWTPINTFAGTLDGQGHTISGLLISAANNGMFKSISGKVGNFTLSNSQIRASDYSGAIVGTLSGELYDVHVDESVTVIHWIKKYVAGLVGQVVAGGNKAIIRNCSFAGKVQVSSVGGEPTTGTHAGILATIKNADCEIVNCVMSGSVEKGWNVGGLVGEVEVGCNVTLRNCLVTGTVSSIRSGNTYVDLLIGTNRSNLYVEDVYSAGTNKGLVDQNNTTIGDPLIESQMDGIAYCWTDSRIYGLTEVITSAADITGSNAWNKLNLDFYSKHNEDGVWVAIDGGVPKLKITVTEKDTVIEDDYTGTTPRYGWYNLHTKKTSGRTTATEDIVPATGTIFQIETVGDMYGFRQQMNSNVLFEGHTIELCNDLVFNPNWDGNIQNVTGLNNWDGLSSNTFKGTFDGKNHTLSKIYQSRTADSSNGGLFRKVNGTIQNLTISDSIFNGGFQNMAAVVGEFSGTMKNVHCDDGVIVSGFDATYNVGGLVGYITNSASIHDSSFAGTVTGGHNQRGTGGLVGTIYEANNGRCEIKGCSFTGTVRDEYMVGGIVGFLRTVTGKQLDVVVENCVVSGTIDNAGSGTTQWGSVCGRLEPNTKITLTNVDTSSCNRTTRCASAEGTVVDNDK